MDRRVRVAALLAGLVGAGLLWATTRALDAVAPPDRLGPGFWPRLALAGFAAACALQLLADRRAARAPDREATRAADAASPLSAPRLGLAIALLLAYAAAMPWLGFALATLLFIGAFMPLAGARGPVGVIATAVLGVTALLYTFVKLVYLPFPKGAGGFERLTLALYRALGIF